MRKICVLLTLLATFHTPQSAQAQAELLDDRWYRIESEHFILLSQVSTRQSRRFIGELEAWRQVAAQVIAGVDSFPTANVPNYVFLFDDEQSFLHFSTGQERAFFYTAPRANFMAVINRNEFSLRAGLHYYSHFLMRNFHDRHVPRWYEEGLSGYLSRIKIDGNEAEFNQFERDSDSALRNLSETLSMMRLFYQDEALASLRLIQIANLKSEALVYYLLHGHADGYPDRRGQLQDYLETLSEGRAPRFAFDLAFDITTAELDVEFHEFLTARSRSVPEISNVANPTANPQDPQRMDRAELAILLGDLALNSGQSENAEMFFRAAMAADAAPARAWSGLGDALRFQEVEEQDYQRDQEIAALFDQALAMAPDDPVIILDYGEYWEAELNDCDKTYPAAERIVIIERVRQSFERALSLVPDSAEAQLAMAQLYLFPEENWSEGTDYQQRAFELLPADSFIREQAVRYAIEAADYESAETLIARMSQPMHFFGVPDYVSKLEQRMNHHREGRAYDACAE